MNDTELPDLNRVSEGRPNIIVDLDGTIAIDDHRRHLIPNEGWTSYFAECVNDVPNQHVIHVMEAFYALNFRVHILTGRVESVQEETERWLARYCVPYHTLTMRKDADHDPHSRDSNPDNFVPDSQVKAAMLNSLGLNRHNVHLVLDDRDVMIRQWRDWGFTAWQVRDEGTLY